MIPFRTQYEKLVKAYINNEVQPWEECACFVGNLLNKNETWGHARLNCQEWGILSNIQSQVDIASMHIFKESDGTYTVQEILDLEKTFMKAIGNWFSWDATDEETLFNAFEKTLLHLRQIHESKGEVIEDYTFKKRKLVAV